MAEDTLGLNLDVPDVDGMTIYTLASSDEPLSNVKGKFAKRKNFAVDEKSKRKSYVKRFRKEWMLEPIFSGWLHPIPNNPEKCYCSVCQVVLLAGHSELEKHASGKKHCDMLNFAHNDSAFFPGDDFDMVRDSKMTDSNDSEMLTGANFDEEILDDENNKQEFIYEINGKLVTIEGGVQGLSAIKLNVPSISQKSTVAQQQIPPNQLTFIKSTHSTPRKANSVLSTKSNQSLPIRNSLPTNVDAKKLMEVMNSETDEEEEDEDFDDSNQILRDMRAELLYTETKINQVANEKVLLFNKIKTSKNPEKTFLDKEWEMRLDILADKRRQQHNIYKLKFLEMEARVRLAEKELKRSKQLHQLRSERLLDREHDDVMSDNPAN